MYANHSSSPDPDHHSSPTCIGFSHHSVGGVPYGVRLIGLSQISKATCQRRLPSARLWQPQLQRPWPKSEPRHWLERTHVACPHALPMFLCFLQTPAKFLTISESSRRLCQRLIGWHLGSPPGGLRMQANGGEGRMATHGLVDLGGSGMALL